MRNVKEKLTFKSIHLHVVCITRSVFFAVRRKNQRWKTDIVPGPARSLIQYMPISALNALNKSWSYVACIQHSLHYLVGGLHATGTKSITGARERLSLHFQSLNCGRINQCKWTKNVQCDRRNRVRWLMNGNHISEFNVSTAPEKRLYMYERSVNNSCHWKWLFASNEKKKNNSSGNCGKKDFISI